MISGEQQARKFIAPQYSTYSDQLLVSDHGFLYRLDNPFSSINL